MSLGPKSTSSRLRKHEGLFRSTVRRTARRVAATSDIPDQSRGHTFRTTSKRTLPAAEGECKTNFPRSFERPPQAAGYDNEVGGTANFARNAPLHRVFFKSHHSCPTQKTATSVVLISTQTPDPKTDSNTQQPRVRKFYGSKQLSPNSVRTRESNSSDFNQFSLCPPYPRGDNHATETSRENGYDDS